MIDAMRASERVIMSQMCICMGRTNGRKDNRHDYKLYLDLQTYGQQVSEQASERVARVK
jgi:hypothetical protein